MVVERCVVDNNAFLLGLDHLYREAMKGHERGELLECARCLAAVLGTAPADTPVEGYYSEEPELTAYFRLVRALQSVDGARRGEVMLLSEYQRLHDVAAAPLYGRARDIGKLLPTGHDPLSQALDESWPEWSVARLMSAAAARAREWDDYSLVGLAARWGDAVAVAALRESVVLSAAVVFEAGPPARIEYAWQVDPDLAAHGNRFIAAYNSLFGNGLPPADADQAETYWDAYDTNDYLGRCVRLGIDDSQPPDRHYHWGIRLGPERTLVVHDFWDTEIWTTDRYQRRATRETLQNIN